MSMDPEIEENIKEMLRLLVADLISDADEKIRLMFAEHSANNSLRSGDTIKRTMNFISEENSRLYQRVLGYLNSAGLVYNPELEGNIQALVQSAQESYKREILVRFKKSTEVAGNPSLYERMLPEVASGMATDLAKFQNELNALSVKLKHSNKVTNLQRAMWVIEAVLVLVSIFIAGMWYKNPSGNYEPILVGLGLIIPLLAICIKLNAKK